MGKCQPPVFMQYGDAPEFREHDEIIRKVCARKGIEDRSLMMRFAATDAKRSSHTKEAYAAKKLTHKERQRTADKLQRLIQPVLTELERMHSRAERQVADLLDKIAANEEHAKEVGEEAEALRFRSDARRVQYMWSAEDEHYARDIHALKETLRIFSERSAAYEHGRVGNTDLFAESFIRFLAAEWRTWLGEPGRGKSGPFVDYVRAVWKLHGLPDRCDESLGAMIHRISKRDGWVGSRGQK